LEYLEKSKKLLSDKEIYYDRSLLCFSKEKRFLNLITITAINPNNINQIEAIKKKSEPYKNPIINNDITYMNSKTNTVYDYSNNHENINMKEINKSLKKDKNKNKNNPYIIKSKNKGLYLEENKPIIFITARVHPGETPSSFLMNGILKFLTNKIDPRSEILRNAFIFKIIPMINIDGVSRGYFRYDTNCLDMNRYYHKDNYKIQPEIFAIKRVFKHFSELGNIKFYYDLHAHASKKGMFLYGNCLDFLAQIENQILPKLIEINSEDLNYQFCNFDYSCLKKTKEKRDKFSKDGTGRIHLQKISDITHCYTVEASFFKGSLRNELKKIKPIDFNLLITPDINRTFTISNKSIYVENLNKENLIEKKENCNINILDDENLNENPHYLTTVRDVNNYNYGKNDDLDLKNEEEIASKKNFRIESLNLLMIIKKLFNIDFLKDYFNDEEILKFSLKNQINKKGDKEKDIEDDDKNKYKKLKEINLILNSSIDSNENYYTKSNQNEIYTDIKDIDQIKNNIDSNNNFEIDINQSRQTQSQSKRKFNNQNFFDLNINSKENKNLFSDLDDMENYQNSPTKVFSEDFSSKNIIYDNNSNKITKEKSIKINKNLYKSEGPKNSKKNFFKFDFDKELDIGNYSFELKKNKNNKIKNENLIKKLELSDKKNKNNDKNDNNSSNIVNDLTNYNKKNKTKSGESIINFYEKIENFSYINFEIYSKLMFYEYHYYNYNNKNNKEYKFTNKTKLKFEKDNSFFFSIKDEEKYYTPVSYEKMGISLLIAILDYEKLNPFSRLGNTEYKCLENLRSVTGKYLFKNDEKFKLTPNIKIIYKNIKNQKGVISLQEKYVNFLTKEAISKINSEKKEKRKQKLLAKTKINFSLKESFYNKSTSKTNFGCNVNFDFPKRKEEIMHISNKSDTNQYISKFNKAFDFTKNNIDFYKKQIDSNSNSNNLFIDNKNKNEFIKKDFTNSPKIDYFLNKIKDKKSFLLTNIINNNTYENDVDFFKDTLFSRSIKTASCKNKILLNNI
jgi:hypothetical protein